MSSTQARLSVDLQSYMIPESSPNHNIVSTVDCFSYVGSRCIPFNALTVLCALVIIIACMLLNDRISISFIISIAFVALIVFIALK